MRKRLIPFGEKHKGDIVTMNYAWITKGNQLPPHAHPDGEEFYYFLEGTGSILVGDQWLDVTGGDFVTVPEGAMHSVKNADDHDLMFLTIRTVKQESTKEAA
jgi:mannose-6-phosphate isomerase-like protein (cupin superfamily)